MATYSATGAFNTEYTTAFEGVAEAQGLPQAGEQTVDEETEIFAGGCKSITITCPTGSTSSLLVNIPGLHDDGEWFQLDAGETRMFRGAGRGIYSVLVDADGADADVVWGVTRLLPRNRP